LGEAKGSPLSERIAADRPAFSEQPDKGVGAPQIVGTFASDSAVPVRPSLLAGLATTRLLAHLDAVAMIRVCG